MKRFLAAICAAPALIIASMVFGAGAPYPNDASAQDYPSRPIRFIVPYPPGGLHASRKQGARASNSYVDTRDENAGLASGSGVASPQRGAPALPSTVARLRDATVRESGAAARTCAAPISSENSYPDKPIRFIVPYPPGGGTDIVARELAPYLTEAWGQQVVIDNRGGAGATIGHGIAAKSTPDGYTMLLGTSGGLVSSPLFGVQVNYAPLRDYEPIGMLADIPFIVVVPASLPVNNIRELIELSKARPEGLNFASPGAGTPNHLAGELLKVLSGMRFVHVPYKGGGPAMTDLMAGEMHFLFTGVPQVLPHVRSGRLRIIASGHPVRSRLAPDAAPIADVYPGFNASTWFCLLFPAGTPKAIAAKFNAQLNRILTSTEFANRLLLQGAEPAMSTPAQVMEKIQVETERWRKVMKDSGLVAGASFGSDLAKSR